MKVERITRVTLEEARKLPDETDWERIETEEAAGLEPPYDEDDFEVDWSTVRWVEARAKCAVSLRLDADLLAYFKAQGKGYQTRMNAVLRAYMEAQQKQR